MIPYIREAQLFEPETTHDVYEILQASHSHDGYLLQIDVSEREAHRLQSKDTERMFRFPVYPAPSDAIVVVPTIQVGDFQLRIAVPLVDDKTIAWARWCIASKKISFLFRVTETDRYIGLNVDQDFPDAKILLGLIEHSRRDITRDEFAIDMSCMLPPLSEPKTIESRIIGIEVTEVCLAMVTDFRERFKEGRTQTQSSPAPQKRTLH